MKGMEKIELGSVIKAAGWGMPLLVSAMNKRTGYLALRKIDPKTGEVNDGPRVKTNINKLNVQCVK